MKAVDEKKEGKFLVLKKRPERPRQCMTGAGVKAQLERLAETGLFWTSLDFGL